MSLIPATILNGRMQFQIGIKPGYCEMGLFLLFCLQQHGFSHSSDAFCFAGMKRISRFKGLKTGFINRESKG